MAASIPKNEAVMNRVALINGPVMGCEWMNIGATVAIANKLKNVAALALSALVISRDSPRDLSLVLWGLNIFIIDKTTLVF